MTADELIEKTEEFKKINTFLENTLHYGYRNSNITIEVDGESIKLDSWSLSNSIYSELERRRDELKDELNISD